MRRAVFPLAAALALQSSPAPAAGLVGSDDITVVAVPASEVPPPGPSVLQWDRPLAPQLTNSGIWQAPPLLVSGASAYRAGEFIYSDFLYDDTGIAYPDEPRYRANAADLVELRLTVRNDDLHIRVTYNTMLLAGDAATTIALGAGPPVDVPRGAGVRLAGDVFVTLAGDVVMVDTPTAALAVAAAHVDLLRRQVRAAVPLSLLGLVGADRVQAAAVTGLWDAPAQSYLVPAGAEHAIANVAFRFDEDAAVQPMWMDGQQNAALADGDLSAFTVTLRLDDLRRGVTDEQIDQPTGPPSSGPMNRIYASHFEPAQGRGIESSSAEQICGPPDCIPPYAGQLQPYSVYVPVGMPPPGGWGVTLTPHATDQNHNNYYGTAFQRQLAQRGAGNLVVGVNARGGVANYYGYAGADLMEVLAEVRRVYPTDPGATAITGYSGGGYATNRFAVAYPDLFAAAAPIAGRPAAPVLSGCQPTGSTANAIPGSDLMPLLQSLRHVPWFGWHAAADELNFYACTAALADRLRDLGYRYRLRTVAPWEHLTTLSADLSFADLVVWLGERRVTTDPARVDYTVDTRLLHDPAVGMNADGAYWLSSIQVYDREVSPQAGVTARSLALMERGLNPVAESPTPVLVADPNAATPAYPGFERGQRWDPHPPTPVEDTLMLDLVNVASVTIDMAAAGLSCDAMLDVSSDGPVELRLAGCAA